MRKILPFILFVYSMCSVASEDVLRINVESTIRNKIDEGLILTSEHHFSTKVLSEERVLEKLNENISIEFTLSNEKPGVNSFLIKGKLLYKGISLKSEFLLPNLMFTFNEKRSVSLSLNDKKTVDLNFYLKKENFDEF